MRSLGRQAPHLSPLALQGPRRDCEDALSWFLKAVNLKCSFKFDFVEAPEGFPFVGMVI